MTNAPEILSLPVRPNLERLRKEAKQRFNILRNTTQTARLADAQLLLARSYGFPSWRAMKEEVERRIAAVAGEIPLPLSVVYRSQIQGNAGERFLALHNSVQIEHAFFGTTVMVMAGMEAMTAFGAVLSILH